MVGRLIADVFRRTWWLHAIGAAQVAVLWMLPAVMPISGAVVFTSLSMVVAFGLGPFVAAFAMNRPEVFLRPLSSRDLWRAVWLYSVVAVPTVLAFAKAVPILLLAPVSRAPLAEKLQGLLLSASLEAIYCGSLLVFLALALRVSRRDVERRLWRGACLAVFFGGVVWPPVFLAYVVAYAGPDSLALTPASAGAFAFAATATGVSLLLAPSTTTRVERSIGSQTSRRRAAAPAGLVASLSGFQIVAWTYGWLLCAGVGVTVVWLFVFATLFPIAARQDALSWAVPIAAFHPALFLMRRLRTMPFTPWQLTTMLISGPVINTLAVCAAGLLAGLATGGRNSLEITPALIVLTVGGGALVSAVQIRLQTSLGSQGVFAVVPLIVIAGKIGNTLGQSAAPAVIVIAGAALFLSAVFLHYRSLTRRNKTFRPIQQLETRRV